MNIPVGFIVFIASMSVEYLNVPLRVEGRCYLSVYVCFKVKKVFFLNDP